MLSKRTLWLTIARNALITGVAILIGGIGVWLLGNQIHAASEDIITAKRLGATLDMRNELLSALSADMEATLGSRERIETALLPVNDILEFVGAIESMALKQNVTETIKFDAPGATEFTVDDTPLVEVPFTLSIQGNIFTFTAFLMDVERLPYFMKITSISLTAPQEGGWQNLSNISVRGLLYAKDAE